MLICLFTSKGLNTKYELTFSYRYTAAYEKGLRSRITAPIEEHPLRLPDVSLLYSLINRRVKIHSLNRILKGITILLFVKYIFFIYDIVRMYALLRKERPDILHINNGGYPGAYSCLAAVLAAKSAKIPKVIFVVNNIATPYKTLLRYLDKPIDRLVAKHTTLFITGSGFARRQLCKVLNLPETKVVNIPNTIIRRPLVEARQHIQHRLGLDDKNLILGSVGLLEKRKGYEYLIDAFALVKQVSEEFNTVKLIIEGSGKEESRLRDLASYHGLENDILFLANEPNIFDIINVLDIFILPSVDNEDFPNVILEAMSLGKPVIGTRLAGISEQISHMETGLVVTPGDAKALSEAILFLLQDRKRRVRMGIAGQERFHKVFSYEKIIERYRKLYAAVLSNGK
jgi:glycosyltransferase involved in cell wall biosynthesis